MIKKNYGFKKVVPKLKVEFHTETINDKEIEIPRRVTHVHNQHRYHSTKGWKKIQNYVPHIMLNTLLIPYGVVLN